MSIEYIVTDASLHFGAGVTVALIDFATHRVAQHKDERIAMKKQCLQSIDYILDQHKKPSNEVQNTADLENSGKTIQAEAIPNFEDSMQYAENVSVVQDYLRRSGMVKMNLPLTQRVGDFFKSLIYQQRINNASAGTKLGIAIGLEVIYDTLIGFKYYTQILKMSPLAAVSTNLYQIPAFYLGLVVGKPISKAAEWIVTSSEEKKLDRAIKQMTLQTPIVDLVVNYQPSEEVTQDMESRGLKFYGTKVTGLGRKVYAEVLGAASEAVHYVSDYQKRRLAHQESERKARVDRFDELTRGR